MDVKALLEIRTNFIRFYYLEAIKPFKKIQNAIENEMPPYDKPPFDESGEPPFLMEWCDAEHGVEFVGLNCVSLLSDSLKLFFDALFARVLCLEFKDKRKAFKHGFVRAYEDALSKHFDIDWGQVDVDFDLIEQVVLARNNAQHGERLSDISSYHNDTTVKKFSYPFFADQNDFKLMVEGNYFLPLKICVSENSLFGAIDEIMKMAKVIDEKVYGPTL